MSKSEWDESEWDDDDDTDSAWVSDWDEDDVETPEIDVTIDEKYVPKKKKRVSKGGRFKAWEDEVIREDWQTCTDEQIAKKIGRTIPSVERRRKILGFTKKNGRPSTAKRDDAIYSSPTEYNLAKLSKEDRIAFYKAKFNQNPRYRWLIEVLMDDEIDYYKHKYIETIDNLDSITMQEEDLLHNMIMKEISILRIQVRVRQQEESWKHADEDDKPPLNMGLYRDLNDAEKQYISYQEKLKLTREQRLKTDKEEKITISAIVRELLDARAKERAGVMAGKMAASTALCKDDMNKMNFLLGG